MIGNGRNIHGVQVSNRHLTCTVLMALLLCHTLGIASTKGQQVYATGEVLEIDRCASAWLIQRFVSPKATILLLPDEELMTTEATQFDTPYSDLRRSHRASTFEVIKERYNLKNPKIDAFAAIIHELEINFWNKKRTAATIQFAAELNHIMQNTQDKQKALGNCIQYLDNYTPISTELKEVQK